MTSPILRIIKLAQKTSILVGEPCRRSRNFGSESLQFGEYFGIGLRPLARNPDDNIGKVAVESVLATTNHFVTASKNAFEVFGLDEIGKRSYRCRLYTALDEGGNSSMDLAATQVKGPRAEHARTCIGSKHIRAAAPG
jgi:hypothetical protein